MMLTQDALLFRELESEEVIRLGEIDRSETFWESYRYRDGILQLAPDYQEVTGFDEQELQDMISRQKEIIRTGGRVIGCFDGTLIAGMASVERQRRGSRQQYCKMDILYVSRTYRGRHIALQLLDRTRKIAAGFGAQHLYISATPTRRTVDFYISQGARPATEPDPELVQLEPLDIHLELDVSLLLPAGKG
ncbi:GNAT family N-acetyltransferase [Taibaiella chishuiensis]|uniref:Acetyltransferase (GNAT) family protein n=1 Tax=Taibaiella chishuiensis TaxID=1434707 RepID=A0A2P8DBP4_9BACT|nr:GNAT family N-acetyltransferase [Taibaiella chishuiensis]PSK94636.1 acetyltransferase (GNAT) family protein [Taibaiella chishuiensis]